MANMVCLYKKSAEELCEDAIETTSTSQRPVLEWLPKGPDPISLKDMRSFKSAFIAILLGTVAVSSANAWVDKQYPDANDSNSRIAGTSWVNAGQIQACVDENQKGVSCDEPHSLTQTGQIYSKANLVDPRGYNLPSIRINCAVLPNAPVKYTLNVYDNAWFLDSNGTFKIPNRIALNIDGRDTLVLNIGADHDTSWPAFEITLSQEQLLRIRAAQQFIAEGSLAFPAQGTEVAIDALAAVCGDK